MSTINRREFLKVSTLAAAGAFLAACGGTPTTAPTNTPAPTTAAQATATTAPKPTEVPATWPRGDVARNHTWIRGGGNGTVGIASPMNPSFNHQNGMSLIQEPCAFYGVHADKSYMWLAESYKYNDTATELDITFRKGIEWSDKTPFTANDMAFAMGKLKTVDGLGTAGNVRDEVDSTEVVDDQNIKIKFNQTDWRFFFKSLTFRFDLGDGSTIVPQHIFKDVADADLKSFGFFDAAKGWPVVTSPYTLVRSEENVNQFDLRLDWWAVKTGLVAKMPDVQRQICVPFTTDTLAAQQIINNDIDVCLDIRPLVIASLLNQTDHVSTWTGKKPPYGYVDWWPISVYFNCMQPPFDNKDVRWAVSYAIDKQQIIDTAWGGAGTTNNSPFPAYPKLNKYMAGIKDLTDKYNTLEYNLDKTKALMTGAGFTLNKDGFWADKDGNVPVSDLWGGVPLFSDMGPVISEQLRAGGFKSDFKAPQDVWAGLGDGRAPMFLYGHGGGTIDPLDTFFNYRSKLILPIGQQGGQLNRWKNTDFDALVQQMNNVAMDDPSMPDLFHKIMEIWYSELPDAPICNWYHRCPVNTTYWDNYPNETNNYMNTAPWHLTQLIVVMNLKTKTA